MKRELLYFTFFLLMCFTLPLTATAQGVDIPDANLRAAVEKALGVAPGTLITEDEMATLTELTARDANISHLTGLEHATHLTRLELVGNNIGDVSVLTGLTKLTALFLDNNRISDLSPLAGLTNLTGLYLGGSSASDLSPLAGLINLESLFLDANGISNLSALAGLTQLTRLALEGNNISDISALAGLTNLTWLRLGHNRILDLSPLVANMGLKSGDQVLLNGNPLNYSSINTHIPTLQGRGVVVEFDDVTNLNFGEPHRVRLIYFLPNDRAPERDIDTKLDTLIRDVQQFYADEMQRHGFEGKTFTLETNAAGKAVVHHVDGQFTDSYYRQNTFHKVWKEIREQFYTPQNIYFIAIDIGNERVGRGYNEVCDVGDSHGASGGHVLIPASGNCFNLKTAAHALGHAFGLQHDFRDDAYIMSLGRDSNKLSECAAEWLDAHRYFNTGQSQTHFDNSTKIQMLSPLASPQYAIRLRFEVTDSDGVHQAQLLTPATIRNQDLGQPKLLSCKRLNGETGTIEIEFITNQLKVISENGPEVLSVEVILSVIDVYGNFTSKTFPIDITTILPTETASTPNRNRNINIPDPLPLPLAVRQAFELDSFYQQWIDIEGFPVVASEKVNPYALKEAAWLIWQMIGHRPEILHAFVQKRVRFVVIGYTEIPTDIPGHSYQAPDFLVYWQRGLGGDYSGHTAVGSSEENLLRYPRNGGSYNTLFHGFAHTIHRFGLNTVDPTFNNRLQITYNAAMEKGLWQGTYASSDRGEYWAEATRAWFHPKGGGSFKGNTRQALKVYDPGIAALLAEVYGDNEWRYTPPATRIHLPHLQGFNPQDSPTFQGWPELEAVYQQLRDPNSDGGGRWVDLRPYDPSLLPSLIESITFGPPTMVAFVNLTQADVLLYRVRYDGTEKFWTRVPPWYIRVSSPTANEIRLIKDLNGRNLAVFQTAEKIGRILIDETLNLITPGLSKVSGDNQSGVPGAVIANPLVIEVRDENGSTLEGISVTFTVPAGGGTLNVTRATTDKNGAAQSTLTLGPNLGTNTVSVSASGIEGTVTFNAVVEPAIDILDASLRAAVETALGTAEGDPITPSEMAALTRLEAPEASIRNLTGLKHATNLTVLKFNNNSISDISAVANLTNLIALHLWKNSVSDLSPLAGLTKLTGLYLGENSASDLSPLTGLTNLESLFLDGNGISDLSPVAGLTKLTRLALSNNSVSDLSPLVGLTNLKWMRLASNNISDLSPLVTNMGLGSGDELDVRGNPLSYLSIHTHLPTLQSRGVAVEFDNRTLTSPLKISGDDQQGTPGTALERPFVVEVRDASGSAFEGVPVTFTATAGGGTLSVTSTTTDANGRAESVLTLGLNPGTNTVTVSVTGSQETRTFNAEGSRIPKELEIISGADQEGLPGEVLEKPFVVEVRDQTDKPLPGVEVTFAVTAGGGTLRTTRATTNENGRAESTLTLGSTPGTNTVRVSVEGNSETVALLTIEAARMPMFTLSIPAGTHAIHIPLAVNQINGEDATIETVGDLYNALGDAVNYIITVGDDGGWKTYLGDISAGSAVDAAIEDDTGLIVVMSDAKTLELVGDALGAGGDSMINIDVGNNLVGLPLKPAAGPKMISGLLVDGVGAIAVSKADGMGFHTITAAGQEGDGPIMGGVGYLVVYTGMEATSIPIVGSPWDNSGAVSAAPAVVFDGTHTPVLYVEGGVMDEFNMLSRVLELRVTVKNLSTGASLDTVLGTETSATSYSGTFVELSRHAAKVGDVIEIAVHSPNPYVGVRPVPQIVVSAEQVLTYRISLPDVELYEIPSETELLANYPNPFNPETWIPYRLAKAAEVTLEIYHTNGSLVRTIDVGFKPAAGYESRASAIYWDGRNNQGESVASGVYFYHLSAGAYSTTRKMLIMK